jgi:hypothetical protein
MWVYDKYKDKEEEVRHKGENIDNTSTSLYLH